MIKKVIKVISVIFTMIILIILYLSFIGIKTEKFNKKITNRIFEINKRINIDLKSVKFLLDPYNFTANVTTKNPTILLDKNKIEIKNIKTNISLRALIYDEFSIDDLQISTKAIKLKDLILLAKSFRNSTELFLLDKFIKDGFLIADIKLKFDNEGNIKNDYQISGFINNGKLNFLNQLNSENLNFNFNITRNKYSLTEINTLINKIRFSSPLIEIKKKNDLFFINGKILTDEEEFNRDQLNNTFVKTVKNLNVEKVRFSSENDISFNTSKKLKFKDLKIESKVNLNQLIIKKKL